MEAINLEKYEIDLRKRGSKTFKRVQSPSSESDIPPEAWRLTERARVNGWKQGYTKAAQDLYYMNLVGVCLEIHAIIPILIEFGKKLSPIIDYGYLWQQEGDYQDICIDATNKGYYEGYSAAIKDTVVLGYLTVTR